MAKVCQYCGRGPVTGNAVSHSNRHTRRRWLVNLQNARIDVGDGTTFKVRVCAKCLKSGFIKRAVNV
jgi:large subunit ribosomal protein L28